MAPPSFIFETMEVIPEAALQRLRGSNPEAIAKITQIIHLGTEKLRSDDFSEAERIFGEAHQEALEASNPLFQSTAIAYLGIVKELQDKHQEALDCFDRAISLYDANPLAWFLKGYGLLLNAERPEGFEDALRCYSRALELDPTLYDRSREARFLELVGLRLYTLKRYEQAVDYFDKALSLDTRLVRAPAWKAHSLLQLDRFKEAEAAVKVAWPVRGKLSDRGKWLYFLRMALAASQGLAALESGALDEAEKQARAYNLWKERTKKKGFTVEVVEKDLEEIRAEHPKEVEEFLELATLLAIKDPFERWKVLGKMISAKWPKGLSAVDAIRELRE